MGKGAAVGGAGEVLVKVGLARAVFCALFRVGRGVRVGVKVWVGFSVRVAVRVCEAVSVRVAVSLGEEIETTVVGTDVELSVGV